MYKKVSNNVNILRFFFGFILVKPSNSKRRKLLYRIISVNFMLVDTPQMFRIPELLPD